MYTTMHTRPRLRFVEQPGTEDGTPGVVEGFTPEQQAKIAAIAAENKARGERAAKAAAEQALADKLGGRTLDDLLAAADAVQAAEDAKKSEAEKALEAALAAKAEAETIRSQAARELHDARVRSALLGAGVTEAGLSAVTVPGVTVESTPEEITAAVTALKTALPGLFTAKVAPGADPGKPGNQAPGEPVGAGGLAEFERRYPKTA